jgi:hypothetical protein
MDALLTMLAPDVVLHADGGGKAQAVGTPLAGRLRVMRLLTGLLRRAGTSVRSSGWPGSTASRAP